MLRGLLATLVILSFACREERANLDYKEGLAQCDSIVQKLREESPNTFVRLTPDCIVGAKIPEFQYVNLEGDSISNTSLLGKLSVMNFWFITCPPCVAEIPGFNILAEEYSSDDVNFIAFGRDRTSYIREFLDSHPWHVQHVSAGEQALYETFNIRWGFPTTFVVDEEGVIVDAFSGGSTDTLAPQELVERLKPVLDRHLQ